MQKDNEEASILLIRCYSLVTLGKHKDALACLDKAIKLNPNFADAWDMKGFILARLGKYEEALDCYNKADELEHRLKSL
jgi:tetratricopeptide (TPR) repeat protein